MHLREADYDQAHTDFFEAFKNYDESGSPRYIKQSEYEPGAACIKHLSTVRLVKLASTPKYKILIGQSCH